MLRAGQVISFDERRGLGEIEADDGTRFPVHGTAIVDGSRRIEPGAAVHFTVVPGRQGRWEAATVVRR